jgi:hypothetical protein
MKFNVGDKLRSRTGSWRAQVIGYANDNGGRVSFYVVKIGTTKDYMNTAPQKKTLGLIDHNFQLDYNGVSLMMEIV